MPIKSTRQIPDQKVLLKSQKPSARLAKETTREKAEVRINPCTKKYKISKTFVRQRIDR